MELMDPVVNDWDEYFDKIIFYIENSIERTFLKTKSKKEKT